MELNIIEDKKNPLLNRRELVCMVTKTGTTPSKADLKTLVANETKSKPECVFVDEVHQDFGRSTSKVLVKVYDKPEQVPGYVAPEPEKKEEKAEEKKDAKEPDAKAEEKSE